MMMVIVMLSDDDQRTTRSLQGVEFWVLNTDAQALESSEALNKVQMGAELTRGLGTWVGVVKFEFQKGGDVYILMTIARNHTQARAASLNSVSWLHKSRKKPCTRLWLALTWCVVYCCSVPRVPIHAHPPPSPLSRCLSLLVWVVALVLVLPLWLPASRARLAS